MQVQQINNATLAARLNEHVQHWHHIKYPDRFKPYHFESVETFFKSWFLQPDIFCFIAFEGEEPAGYAVVMVKNQGESAFTYPSLTVYVDQLAVHPGFRRNGVGKKLIEEVLRFAKQQKATQVELDHWSLNDDAHRFFERVGFSTSRHKMTLVL